MKWKLTFGVFAVIILTVEAVVWKICYMDQFPTPYIPNTIRKMISKIRPDIYNCKIYSILSNVEADEWKNAIEGTYTTYSCTISRNGGATLVSKVPLKPHEFNDENGNRFRVEGSYSIMSDTFPTLETNAEKRRVIVRTNTPQRRNDGMRFWFEKIEPVMEDAMDKWNGDIPDNYEISDVTWRNFDERGITIVFLGINPTTGPVVKRYDEAQMNDWLKNEWTNANRSEIYNKSNFTISEKDGSTVIESFDLRNLDFLDGYVTLVDINYDDSSVMSSASTVHMSLEFPSVEISVECHSTTTRRSKFHGHYDGPSINVTFDKLRLDVSSRWRDDDTSGLKSVIYEVKIMNFYFDDATKFVIEYDPKMKSVINDMIKNINGIMQQLFRKIETEVKESDQVQARLKKFLQSMFYDYGELNDETDDDDGPIDETDDETDDGDDPDDNWINDAGFI